MSVAQNLPDTMHLASLRNAFRVGDEHIVTPVIIDNGERLKRARVSDDGIPDGRPYRKAALSPMASLAGIAAFPGNTQSGRALGSQLTGLRLLPLSSFAWGTRQAIPKPQTRGDNCLILLTSGALQIDFPARREILGSGDLRYIPAGTAFATSPFGNTQGMVLLLSSENAARSVPALPSKVTAGNIGGNSGTISATLNELAREAVNGDTRTNQAVACHLGLLAVQLDRASQSARVDESSIKDSQANPDIVQKFLTHARKNLASNKTIAELAEDLGMTTATLDQICISQRGQRAIEVVHELRHECAVEALRHSTRSVDWIAQDVGYSSLAHFNRAFVAATGRTPELFRREAGLALN